MSRCMFCGSESVEEDMQGQLPLDAIVIKCRQCGRRTFITGEKVLEAKRRLGMFGSRKRIEYY